MENNNVNYLVINEVNDFLRLRNIKENESMVIVINKNINFNDIEFKPINAKTNNIIIYGLNNKISNLKIDNGQEENTGLFSEVKNLYVRGLEIDNFSIYGGVCTGSLVGNASEYVSVKNSKFNGLIDAEAYAGGLVGTCKKLELENNNINTMVKESMGKKTIQDIKDNMKKSNSFNFDKNNCSIPPNIIEKNINTDYDNNNSSVRGFKNDNNKSFTFNNEYQKSNNNNSLTYNINKNINNINDNN